MPVNGGGEVGMKIGRTVFRWSPAHDDYTSRYLEVLGLVLPHTCDIIGGDFNHTLAPINRRTRTPLTKAIIKASARMVQALEKDKITYYNR